MGGYWAAVFPVARRELAAWRGSAAEIPDPRMRALALQTLDEEHGLAEGAAIFAALVPGRAARRELVRLLVAWQVAYDYLDTIGEHDFAGRSIESEALYSVLRAALEPDRPCDVLVDDGEHLDRLIACCRASVAALPSIDAVRPFALRAAERCAEAQVLTHAVVANGPEPLRRWALSQPGVEGFLWWEVAAGAISSLAVHALLATAALRDATAAQAARIDAAYFPSICALSTLLDSTIDTAGDAGTANHRPLAYYDDPEQAAARAVAVTRIASAAARALPHGRGHLVILAGMTAYYAAAGWTGHERTHRAVAAAVGVAPEPIVWTLRLRKLLRRSPPSPQSRGDGAETAGTPPGRRPLRERTRPPMGDSAGDASDGGGAGRGVRDVGDVAP